MCLSSTPWLRLESFYNVTFDSDFSHILPYDDDDDDDDEDDDDGWMDSM